MSAFVVTTPPSRISLYTTVSIATDVLTALQADFDLGAHKGYNEAVALDISPRTDLHGLTTPEDVLRALVADGTFTVSDEAYSAFLIADEATLEAAKRQKEYIVWYVEGWSTEDQMQKENLDPNAGAQSDENGRWNFAAKSRFYAYAGPITYVNREIANTSLEEQLDFPYDPWGVHKPQDAGTDWRKTPPESAYVLADASHYEVSSATEAGGPQVMRLGGGPPPDEKRYRMKKEIADKLGLISDWTMGNRFDHRERTHRPEIMEKANLLDPETCMMLSADWDLEH